MSIIGAACVGFVILAVVIVYACCSVSGTISQEEDAAEWRQECTKHRR